MVEKEVHEDYDMKKELLKTLVPIVFGAIAGAISFFITGNVRERDPFGIIILVLLIYAQKFVFPRFGIEIESKDWAGFTFLSFASWYVAWTMLLNSGLQA